MAKSMPRAGRPRRTPGSKPAPRTPGMTQDSGGTVRDRAKLDVPWNPLGAVNGPDGGTGRPVPKGARRAPNVT